MVPPRPNPRAVATLWKYDEMRPCLMEAGRIIGAEEAERRVLMLVNSAMEAPHTTDTLYAGLQLVLPGETAPAHRHVAFALRFIVEGEHGFTAVEGQKIPMEAGDVILTPPWHWHDHGNEGTKPLIWLDGLDLPLFRSIPVNFSENYLESRYPSLTAADSQLRFPWAEVQAVLDAAALPYVVHHYRRKGRRALSETVGAQAERIAGGYKTPVQQETCSFIYHVKHGQGRTSLVTSAGESLVVDWKSNDTFAVPAWSQIQHTNMSSDNAYLFAINDRPLLEELGLMRGV
ncbi:C6 transcription factor [Pleurostoma richardsiae]|uniref:C6 transcription factor n=1 Tax=Pleurostoma richardsiae TaxID=41990 RepID=A0AA38RHM6_9PEZI|nr:C6 transcription factor [Pleurostoma richardsiae]